MVDDLELLEIYAATKHPMSRVPAADEALRLGLAPCDPPDPRLPPELVSEALEVFEFRSFLVGQMFAVLLCMQLNFFSDRVIEDSIWTSGDAKALSELNLFVWLQYVLWRISWLRKAGLA